MSAYHDGISNPPEKIIILEPAIIGFQGHYFNYILAIKRAAGAHGLGVKVVGPRGMEEAVRQELEAAGVEVDEDFFLRPIEAVRARIAKWPLLSIDMGRVLLQQFRKEHRDSVFCVMSGQIDYIVGAMTALRWISGSSVIMQMFFWQQRRDNSSFGGRGVQMLFKGTELALQRNWDGGGMTLVGQTQVVADHLSEVLLRAVPHLPLVIDWSLFEQVNGQPRPWPETTIGFAGAIRFEKGFEQFVCALDMIKSPFRAHVHVKELISNVDSRSMIDRLRQDSRCSFLEGALSPMSYAAFLKSLDIVVLPYDPADYRCRTSSVFAEAIGLGKVVVAPAETWMGNTLADHGLGPTYSEYSPRGLAEAIDEALQNRAQYEERVREFSVAWREEHCAENFVRRLLEIHEGRSQGPTCIG